MMKFCARFSILLQGPELFSKWVGDSERAVRQVNSEKEIDETQALLQKPDNRLNLVETLVKAVFL